MPKNLINKHEVKMNHYEQEEKKEQLTQRKVESTNRRPYEILDRQPRTSPSPRRPYDLRHPEERIHAPHE